MHVVSAPTAGREQDDLDLPKESAPEIVLLQALDLVQMASLHSLRMTDGQDAAEQGARGFSVAGDSYQLLLVDKQNEAGAALTFIASKSSSSSCEDAPLISGAAGMPSYLAMPERIETSLLYAMACRTRC